MVILLFNERNCTENQIYSNDVDENSYIFFFVKLVDNVSVNPLHVRKNKNHHTDKNLLMSSFCIVISFFLQVLMNRASFLLLSYSLKYLRIIIINQQELFFISINFKVQNNHKNYKIISLKSDRL